MNTKKWALTDENFNALKAYIYKVSKIDIKDKKYLLEQRLEAILNKYKMTGYSDLVKKIASFDKTIGNEVIVAMTTNETFFFRDKNLFNGIETEIIPKLFDLATKREAKIWCAACSTGQEPYSIAMLIASYTEKNIAKKALKTNLKIAASDIDISVLKKAKDAVYTDFEISRGLPQDIKKAYFTSNDGGMWVVDKQIRSMVHFNRMNLIESAFYPSGLDLVLCRNVLIYFSNEIKQQIVGQIHGAMNPGGYFIIGGSESLHGISEKFDRIELGNFTIYMKKVS